MWPSSWLQMISIQRRQKRVEAPTLPQQGMSTVSVLIQQTAHATSSSPPDSPLATCHAHTWHERRLSMAGLGTQQVLSMGLRPRRANAAQRAVRGQQAFAPMRRRTPARVLTAPGRLAQCCSRSR